MRDNPFSVPDAPLASIDTPKSRTKKVLHILAFAMIVVVWYGVVFVNLKEPSDCLFLFHAVVMAILYNGNFFSPSENMPFLWVIEIAFAAVLGFTAWRRSLRLTLFVLAFVVCWSVANAAYVVMLITDDFK